MRRTIFATLATLTMTAAPAAAHCPSGVSFEKYGYGGRWADHSYPSVPCTWTTGHHRATHARLRSRASGFYLVGSPSDNYDRYRNFGFGWPGSWWRPMPML